MATRDLTAIAFFAALTVVCAQVSVTLPGLSGVPFTLQVFAVLAAGAVLGARRGMLSQIVYLLLGVAGLPVFAGWHGGAPILVGPTAGYLWAFPLAALIVGWCADAAARAGSPRMARWGVYAGMVVGLAVIYGLGAAGLVVSRTVRTLHRAVQVGVLPFVWVDLIKAYLA
ncbi:MAG TPA: biotin transporter BioY, partial [bacterium]|nr:biotin transporter BioY [bacterium]